MDLKFLLILIAFFSLTRASRDNNHNNENYLDYVDDLKTPDELKSSFRVDLVESGPCNIPVEHAPITQREFINKYAYSSPVIFRRSVQERETNRAFEEACQFERIADVYGEKFVTISQANTYSYKKYSIRLRDYLRDYVLGFDKSGSGLSEAKLKYGNETWYFFGENNYTEWRSLLDLYDRPKYTLPGHTHAYSFGIAGFYTGVR